MVCGTHTPSIDLQVIFRHSFPVTVFPVDSFGVHVVVLMLSLSVGRMKWDGLVLSPPFLGSRVIDQLLESSAQGTLVVPFIPLQRWWPQLAPRQFQPACIWFMVDWRDLLVHPGLFKGSVDRSLLP